MWGRSTDWLCGRHNTVKILCPWGVFSVCGFPSVYPFPRTLNRLEDVGGPCLISEDVLRGLSWGPQPLCPLSSEAASFLNPSPASAHMASARAVWDAPWAASRHLGCMRNRAQAWAGVQGSQLSVGPQANLALLPGAPAAHLWPGQARSHPRGCEKDTRRRRPAAAS